MDIGLCDVPVHGWNALYDPNQSTAFTFVYLCLSMYVYLCLEGMEILQLAGTKHNRSIFSQFITNAIRGMRVRRLQLGCAAN